jgi:hypothetical protein
MKYKNCTLVNYNNSSWGVLLGWIPSTKAIVNTDVKLANHNEYYTIIAVEDDKELTKEEIENITFSSGIKWHNPIYEVQ